MVGAYDESWLTLQVFFATPWHALGLHQGECPAGSWDAILKQVPTRLHVHHQPCVKSRSQSVGDKVEPNCLYSIVMIIIIVIQ